MSNYLVDGADLTSVANAIRTKGGTSASLAFPSGFVSAIAAIPSGGGGSDYLVNRLNGTLTEYSSDDVTTVTPYAFNGNQITTVSLPNCISLGNNAFRALSSLTALYIPKVTTLEADALNGVSNLTVLALPAYVTSTTRSLQNMTRLATIDFGPNANVFGQLSGSALTTIIIRKSTVLSLGSTNYLSATFANGGAGGTIYIPKVLYDHLGDGTSLDYKAATNWSTIDGYGTITWAQIEGSQYENYYADGTAIPSS